MADPPPAHWTTATVAPRDRIAYWCDAICAAYVPLSASPAGEQPFYGSVEMQTWGQVRLSQVVSSGQHVVRRADDASGDCLVSLQVAGRGRVTQGGRTAVLQPGAMALYDPTRAYALDFDDSFTQIVVQFPRSELTARGIDVPSAAARSCAGGLTAVSAALVCSAFSQESAVTGPGRALLSNQVLDCLAGALAPGGQQLDAPGEAGRAAARQLVLSAVQEHLDDPRLSVGHLAQVVGRSVRSLQRLFADQPVGLAGLIRSARLARATRALVDPRLAQHSISRIAAEHGYADAAHFARVFREQHDRSPSEHRRAHRPSG